MVGLKDISCLTKYFPFSPQQNIFFDILSFLICDPFFYYKIVLWFFSGSHVNEISFTFFAARCQNIQARSQRCQEKNDAQNYSKIKRENSLMRSFKESII